MYRQSKQMYFFGDLSNQVNSFLGGAPSNINDLKLWIINIRQFRDIDLVFNKMEPGI